LYSPLFSEKGLYACLYFLFCPAFIFPCDRVREGQAHTWYPSPPAESRLMAGQLFAALTRRQWGCPWRLRLGLRATEWWRALACLV